MVENKSGQLPDFTSNEEIIDFFETHDMGDYESELLEVNFDVDIKRNQYLVAVDEDIMTNLLVQARKQQTSVELLVNSWLKEKLTNYLPS